MAPAVGQAKALPAFARAVLTLLHALSAAPPPRTDWTARGWPTRSWRRLLPWPWRLGHTLERCCAGRELFRLLRLARRLLLDLEAGVASQVPERRRLPHVGTARSNQAVIAQATP